MLATKKVEDKIEYKRNTALAKREVRRRHRASWDKLVTHLEHKTHRTRREVYRILKQISKDRKKTTKIHRNIDENVCLWYCEKLWDTTNINVSKLESRNAIVCLEYGCFPCVTLHSNKDFDKGKTLELRN